MAGRFFDELNALFDNDDEIGDRFGKCTFIIYSSLCAFSTTRYHTIINFTGIRF